MSSQVFNLALEVIMTKKLERLRVLQLMLSRQL